MVRYMGNNRKRRGVSMRGYWIAVVLALATSSAAASTVVNGQLTPLGYCQLTSLSGAVKLTSCTNGIPLTANVIVAVPETQAVRWRDDGTAPSSTVGMPIATGVALVYQGNLTTIQFIEQTSSATLNVVFYRY